MKITFHGAAQTVTGSQHLITVNNKNILLDCGMYQGKREVANKINRNLPFPAQNIDAVILSHAHIDHSGNLPNLVKSGFDGPIYATTATAHLADIMLRDSGHIQEKDAEYLNEKLRNKGQPPIEPLYTEEDALRVRNHFRAQKYNQSFEVAQGVNVCLVDAGHILGSAAVVLEIEEYNLFKPRKTRLWFSGDIGRRKLPILRDPVLPDAADVMIMECTYGDRSHEDPDLAFEEMRQVVKRTVERGGKVIVPSFAVGRTQDIVYNLQTMMAEGDLPRVPVVVDSPLAVEASDIYKTHPECFDEETWEFLSEDRRRKMLGFDLLTYTRSVDESKALNQRKEPMVIISASGMAETGRILHHLKNNIEDPRNTVMIVSWQAPDTLGRRLADGEKRIRIFGEEYERKAEVVKVEGLSAHGGQNFLFEYAMATRGSLNKLYLVHGEAQAAEALTARLSEAGMENICYPELHEWVEI